MIKDHCIQNLRTISKCKFNIVLVIHHVSRDKTLVSRSATFTSKSVFHFMFELNDSESSDNIDSSRDQLPPPSTDGWARYDPDITEFSL